MWYFLCLLIGGAIGCFVCALIIGSSELAQLEEDLMKEYYKAMLESGLDLRTAQNIERKVKKSINNNY